MPPTTSSCTIFSGPDEFRRRRALAGALDARIPVADRDFNLTRLAGKGLDPAALATALDTPPLFADARAVIVEDAQLLSAAAVTVLAHAMERAIARADNTLVVLVDVGEGKKPDKALLTSGATHQPFEAMRARDAVTWLREYARSSGAGTLSSAVAEAIVAATGPEQAGPLAREVDKLSVMATGRVITIDDVAQATTETALPGPYPFYDAVGERRHAEAVTLLDALLTNPEYGGVRIIIGLSGHLSGIGLARARLDAGGSARAVAGTLGGWAGDKLVAQALHWNGEDVDTALSALSRADWDVKHGRPDRATLMLFLARAIAGNSR